jgi:hypothetical protein
MATASVMAKVLTFPEEKIHRCPTCERACSADDLSECLGCGQQYCSKCSWECACDRAAADMQRRLPEPDGLIDRLLDVVGVL